MSHGDDARTQAVPRLTYSVRDMRVLDFLQTLAIDGGVSIVSDPDLDGQVITIDVTDLPVPEILRMVARRLGVAVTEVRGTFMLGEIRKEDRAVLIRKVGRMQQEDLKTAVAVMVSDVGKAEVYRDGLVVVADRAEVLTTITEILDRVEAAPSNVWVVQLYFVQADRRYSNSVGLDVSVNQIDLAATFAAASGGFVKPETGAKVAGMLSGTFTASLSDQNTKLVAKPLFLLLDGEKGVLKLGERVPLPRRTVHENGSVSVNGYDFIEAGFEVDLQLRELGGDSVRLDMAVKVGEVTGFVEEAPIVSEQTFDVSTAVQSGGVYLVGSLERQRLADTVEGVLRSKRDRQTVDATLEVWLRVQRVGGGVIFDEKPEQTAKTVVEVAPQSIISSSAISQVEGIEPPAEFESVAPYRQDWGVGLAEMLRSQSR